MRTRAERRPQVDERGAILVLALVCLLAVGLTVVALASFAASSNTNTINLRTEATLNTNAQSAASVAIQQVRTSFNYQPQAFAPALQYNVSPASSDAAICSPSWAEAAFSFRVYCVGFQNAGAQPTRTVDFYVCAVSVSFGSCTGCPPAGRCTASSATPASAVAMFAEAEYNDVPPAAPSTAACGSAVQTTCGLTMTISAWDLRLAD